MKILYHNDADGHGAAAIVLREFANPWIQVTKDDLIEYGHTGDITINEDKINEGEFVFIVDLALDDAVMKAIKKFLKKKCMIVHIDHHIGGQRYLESMDGGDKILYENVKSFFNTNFSGCMLSWLYSNMTEEDREHPNDVSFDFTEDFSTVRFHPDEKALKRDVHIPIAVRLIDDNDIWRNKFLNSKYFALAYQLHDNSPIGENNFWNDLLYGNDRGVFDYIHEGEIIYRYKEKENLRIQNNGFEYEIDGFKGFVVNHSLGNSRIFGDKFEQYDFVCKYSYDGTKWRYTLYSKEASTFDCAEICKKYFNGGGHVHAAGGWLEYNYFNDEL